LDRVGGDEVFENAPSLATFFANERLMGGLRSPFSVFVATRLKGRFTFPCSGAEAAEWYRACAGDDFGDSLCNIELEHAAFAELGELDIEEHGVRTATDVFMAMAVVVDIGDQVSSHAAQAARAFARMLPNDLPAWAMILGWRTVAKRLVDAESVLEMPASVGGLVDILSANLHIHDMDSGRLAGDGDIGANNSVVVNVWRTLVRSAMEFRSRSASIAYACRMHQHHPLPPAKPFPCVDFSCDVHHIGRHSMEMHSRAMPLTTQLQRELELLVQRY
jgi:hypothetical protein